MNPFWKPVVVFAAGFIAAWLRVLFTRRSAEGLAAAAATYHTAISLSASVGTILFVTEWRMIPALLAGCWIGTFFAVRHDMRRRHDAIRLLRERRNRA